MPNRGKSNDTDSLLYRFWLKTRGEKAKEEKTAESGTSSEGAAGEELAEKGSSEKESSEEEKQEQKAVSESADTGRQSVFPQGVPDAEKPLPASLFFCAFPDFWFTTPFQVSR